MVTESGAVEPPASYGASPRCHCPTYFDDSATLCLFGLRSSSLEMNGEESILHALRDCSIASNVWGRVIRPFEAPRIHEFAF
ncbi:hypothetical protein V6N12_029108 [Hibiscus sabdariffa]|uniref:Uncharacterized protein n=1 Tax=Hibiscus sabdariffa TaxID=183260 RepID=A0ABR2A1T6_9ROSI